MNATKSARIRKPQPRFLSFTPATDDTGALLTLEVGKDRCHYGIEEIPAFPGERAFNVTRLDVGRFSTYTVRVTSPTTAECDCPGGTYTKATDGRGGCKHSHAILKLVELGKVSDPAPVTTETMRKLEAA